MSFHKLSVLENQERKETFSLLENWQNCLQGVRNKTNAGTVPFGPLDAANRYLPLARVGHLQLRFVP